MELKRRKRIVMGITGASGAPYSQELLRQLLALDIEVHLIVSASAVTVMREELGITFPNDVFDPAVYVGAETQGLNNIVLHNERDIASGPSSGSFRHDGMIICPCSMKTLGTIAHGTGANLVSRAADACLKERRRLVLVPRETPLNLIHLRNMTSVTEAGAIVLPAMPGFYKRPESVADLIKHLVLKMLDALQIEHHIDLRWKDR